MAGAAEPRRPAAADARPFGGQRRPQRGLGRRGSVFLGHRKQQSTENWDSKLDSDMEQNVAYKSCMHEITEQQSTENWVDSKLDMEHNVAYESSNTAQISLGTNVAYYESGRQLEENVYGNDYQYDYI